MAIIQSLRKHTNIEVVFYNIDFHRPSFEDVQLFFKKNKCNILAISAVVSTAYEYVKRIVNLIKTISPETIVIVGGNLAASAEILHKIAKVDYCVVGDGEKIIVELVNYLTDSGTKNISEIKGVSYIDKYGEFRFNGYGERISAEEIETPDYKILKDDGSLDYFISERVSERLDQSSLRVEKGKKIATVVMTKGCVARCTFCHRWEKGFRPLPNEKLKKHLEYLVNEHNVGFIQVADENFGSDKKGAHAIAEILGSLGLIWQVAGVRTSTVTPEDLLHWQRNGCLAVYYGIESGSQKMLDIMEKKTTVEQNISALKWTGEAKLNTIIQLIIGMPGEDDLTIEETINFLESVAPYIRLWENRAGSESLSINYAQALPGTPLYEFGRENGLIGKSLEEEEKYLLSISDTDAYSEDHFVNMTDQPLLKVLSWRKYMQARVDDIVFRHIHQEIEDIGITKIINYYFVFIVNIIYKKLLLISNNSKNNLFKNDYIRDSGYFNVNAGLKLAPLLRNKYTKRMLFPIIALYVIINQLLHGRILFSLRIIIEYIVYSLGYHNPKIRTPRDSLRKTVKISFNNNFDIELRKGR